LAISFVLLLPATLAWGQTCCTLPTAEVADPGSKLQVGSSGVYRMLGSPSGQAHADAFGAPFKVLLESGCNASYLSALWLLSFSANTYYIPGTNTITCGTVEVPYISDAQGTGDTLVFYPAFTAVNGGLDLSFAVPVPDASCHLGDYRTIGPSLKLRSTDLNGDGDTDEADEAVVVAAMGQVGTNIAADLDMSDTVTFRDVQLVRAEARREAGVGATRYSTTQCAPLGPISYDSGDQVQYPPPRTTNFAVTNLGATIQFTWTASNEGADSSAKAATAQEIRRSSVPITSLATYVAGTVISGVPSAASPGTSQSVTIPYVHGYYAMRSMDDAGNWSAVSDSVQVADIPPGRVTDLGAAAGRGNIKLGWTSTGEDTSVGTAYSYDIRQCQCSSASFTWSTATPIGGPTPAESGNSECMVISFLPDGTTFSFALKTRDVAGNWSLMSNVASATTRTTGTLTYECGGGGLIAQQEGPGPEQARQLTLGSFTPNPASQGGSCLLTIPGEMAAAQVEAGVYDLLGRLVRSLRPGGLEPGIRSLAWDLRDDAGRRVVPGLYFVRARIGANELRKSVVVSR
jgi:hypothetical protein